jgi:pantetheine-phosphate adenylyltransferase
MQEPFDPITNGHLDIIKRSMNFCDTLIVAIGINPMKKPTFSETERIQLIFDSTQPLYLELNRIYGYDKKLIIASSFSGLLTDFAKKENATILIRGIRSVSDFEYELTLAGVNKILAPGIETVFLPTSPDLAVVSSSMVKEIGRHGGDISQFVPANVALALKSIFAK